VAAIKRQFGLQQLGSLGACDGTVLDTEIAPTAADHVRQMLGLEVAAAELGTRSPSGQQQQQQQHRAQSAVVFGNHTHELLVHALARRRRGGGSCGAPAVGGNGPAAAAPLHVLTIDSECEPLRRVLGASLMEASFTVEGVAAEPLASFVARFAGAARGRIAEGHTLGLLWVRQCVEATRATLVPDVPLLAAEVAAAVAAAPGPGPLLVLDGSHAFGAIPTDLSAVPASAQLVYLASPLAYAGSGLVNCACMVVPPTLGMACGTTSASAPPPLGGRPGGSPAAYVPALLIFNEVMQRWKERGICVTLVHSHVLRLQRRLLQGLQALEDPQAELTDDEDEAVTGHSVDGCGGNATQSEFGLVGGCPGGITLRALHAEALSSSTSTSSSTVAVVPSSPPPSPPVAAASLRSHTLAFEQHSPAEAQAVVETLAREFGVAVDRCERWVRVGFGFNHHPEDVDRLLKAATHLHAGGSYKPTV
jgi:hypothetical protein